MRAKTTLVIGMISGLLLTATTSITPASQVDAEPMLDQLLLDEESYIGQDGDELYYETGVSTHASGLRGGGRYGRVEKTVVRKLRRRGLVPVTDFRIIKGRLIIWAEDDNDLRYKVTANRRTGNIIKIARVRGEHRYRAETYDDWYDPYWNGSPSILPRRRIQRHDYRVPRKYRKDRRRHYGNAGKRANRKNRNVNKQLNRQNRKAHKRANKSTNRVNRHKSRDHRYRLHGHSGSGRSAQQREMWLYGSGR